MAPCRSSLARLSLRGERLLTGPPPHRPSYARDVGPCTPNGAGAVEGAGRRSAATRAQSVHGDHQPHHGPPRPAAFRGAGRGRGDRRLPGPGDPALHPVPEPYARKDAEEFVTVTSRAGWREDTMYNFGVFTTAGLWSDRWGSYASPAAHRRTPGRDSATGPPQGPARQRLHAGGRAGPSPMGLHRPGRRTSGVGGGGRERGFPGRRAADWASRWRARSGPGS